METTSIPARRPGAGAMPGPVRDTLGGWTSPAALTGPFLRQPPAGAICFLFCPDFRARETRRRALRRRHARLRGVPVCQFLPPWHTAREALTPYLVRDFCHTSGAVCEIISGTVNKGENRGGQLRGSL